MNASRPRIYLDWNATTPLRPEARAAMAAAFDIRGNPSSVHAEGRAARMLIEDARAAVGEGLGVHARNVVFTSGGTEANALALAPGLAGPEGAPERLIVSAIEHPSVMSGGPAGRAPELAPVTADGVVDLDALAEMLAGGARPLVSVMLANNETGAVQPISEVAHLVHEAGGLLHVDAVQAFGKIDFDISGLDADLVSISAHKLGGPKGIGALVMRDERIVPNAVLRGGGQERGRRGGTENVIGIAGFGAAARAALSSLTGDAPRMAALRDRLERALKQHPGTEIIAERARRLPNTAMVALKGLKAETTVIGFDLAGIAISAGSACASGKVHASHALVAMGLPAELGQSALRFSLGWTTREDEIDAAVEVWRRLARGAGGG